jgi:hypothetical protein
MHFTSNLDALVPKTAFAGLQILLRKANLATFLVQMHLKLTFHDVTKFQKKKTFSRDTNPQPLVLSISVRPSQPPHTMWQSKLPIIPLTDFLSF